MKTLIKVGIVDDHPVVVKGIRTILDPHKHIEISCEVNTGPDLMNWLQGNEADVILLDIDLPGMDGIDICEVLTREYPTVKTIALTAYKQFSFIKSMIWNGAKGYIYKNTSEKELVKAIETVHSGQEYFAEDVYRKLVFKNKAKERQNFIPKLTRREKQVLELVFAERTNPEIAAALFISVSTVETHRMNLCAKLGARNSAGLIKHAIKFGFLN